MQERGRHMQERGRHMRQRGRYFGQGYAPDNHRGFFSRGRGRAENQSHHHFPPVAKKDIVGGNLIVINPQLKVVGENKDSNVVNINNNDAPDSTNLQVFSTPKLVLPQDKYHTSGSTTTVKETTSAEPAPPKPRGMVCVVYFCCCNNHLFYLCQEAPDCVQFFFFRILQIYLEIFQS